MYLSWFKVISLILFIGVSSVRANSECERLIEPIAFEVGIPLGILRAISKVESNDQPYAVNHQGKSLPFTTESDAWSYIQRALTKGRESMDIGCMQINWKAHGGTIGSARLLLNPDFNIRYGAYFLKKLYKEFGSWSQAVAAYHSRHDHYAQGYLIKIARMMKRDRPQMRWPFLPCQDGRLKCRVSTVPVLAVKGFTTIPEHLRKRHPSSLKITKPIKIKEQMVLDKMLFIST